VFIHLSSVPPPRLLYLKHHHTYLLDTLDDGLRGPRDGHRPLGGVGEHVACNLDLSSCGLQGGSTCIQWERSFKLTGLRNMHPRGNSSIGAGVATSLISLILEPPLPMREPHWLAGTTSLRVTGGLLVAGLLLIELIIS